MAKKEKYDGTPTIKNGLLVVSTVKGRLPDKGNCTVMANISARRNGIADDVCVIMQRELYRTMRRETNQGMIIVVNSGMKATCDYVLYEAEMYLGKPSPNLSAIFKEAVRNLDVEKYTKDVENKWYDRDDDDETTPDGI